jgi:hypothetical protein
MDQSSHGTSKPKISITDGSLMLATLFKYSKPKPSEDEFKSITETIEKLQGLKVIKGNAVTKSVLQKREKGFQ